MGENLTKYLLALFIGSIATLVGYKFLVVDLNPKANAPQQEAPASVDPVFTTQTLPEQKDNAKDPLEDLNKALATVEGQNQAPPQRIEPAPDLNAQYEQSRLAVVENLQKQGSKLIDSRVFANKADCDTTIKKLYTEYRQRGVPKRDIVQTDAFSGSTGAVIMFNINGQLYYAGCASPPNIPWAVYVQFIR